MNHPLGRPPKAIVFDLDGTLIDSAPDLRAAVNSVLEQAGRPPLSLDAVKSMVGDGVAKLVERAFAATGGPPAGNGVDGLAGWVARFSDAYHGDGFDLTHPYPGAAEVLGRLGEAGIRLAICTNKPQAAAVEVLRRLGLAHHFGAVLGGDALNGLRKPDPRHLLATLEALAVEPADAVMVGDHLNDLACARGAGTPAVLCSYGYSLVPVAELGADAVIDGLDELPAAIAGLATGAEPGPAPV